MKKQLLVLALAASLSLPALPQSSYAYTYEVQQAEVVSTVNFREAPSTSGARIRYLKPGEVVEVISEYNAYWLQVKDASGTVGYISSSSKYATQKTTTIAPEPNGEVIYGVNLRTAPTTDSTVVRMLKKGEPVWVLEQVAADWYLVGDQHNVIGYTSAKPKYIRTTFEPGQIPAPAPIEPEEEEIIINEPEEELFQSEPNGTIVGSVSFRTGPSTSSDRIRYLKKGEQVVVVDKHNSYWYYVQDANGEYGYISTSDKYITTTYVEPYKLLDRAEAAELAIAAGMKYLGVPYEFGSNRYDTTTFDCSDFVRQAFKDAMNLVLPGDSRSQGSYVKSVGKTANEWRDLKRGDLMFFMSYQGRSEEDYEGIDKASERITHVGIYLGDGKLLHTYSVASGGVRVDNIAGSHWELRFLFGGATY